MRKTSVRRFIHAVIDILPLLIIPIFALNILHKETEPISIEVQEKESVDFNQITKPISIYTNSTSLTAEILNDYQILLNGTASNNNLWVYGNGSSTATQFKVYQNHKYLSKGLTVYKTGWSDVMYFDRMDTYKIISCPINADIVALRIGWATGTTFTNFVLTYNIFDLTQMFGEGNEPTIDEFFTLFPNAYYENTESQKMLVNKPTTTTFNSTDIGSQFVYALYKPVNDYFNFNNLFNMGAIYDWIQLNLFSGTAPLPIFIIWNVIVYEFFVDLIFLLYGVFMFIIDFAEKCLERPFRR